MDVRTRLEAERGKSSLTLALSGKEVKAGWYSDTADLRHRVQPELANSRLA
ncbi:hypothetical protein FHS14_004446 [Paenibacillus baekrokdamisoli]|uniref:hypothetical protein n=1 Tax=Paenibacillus baekrokdamisoli TaxID=1712516 RepID=UPI0013E0CFBB|nr:hypothetical protein [Paenibacillus baekrokdamisoli]MBB3071437.1 hypothetical protein [Paenibacillus baekrokdamisoli]